MVHNVNHVAIVYEDEKIRVERYVALSIGFEPCDNIFVKEPFDHYKDVLDYYHAMVKDKCEKWALVMCCPEKYSNASPAESSVGE